MSKWLEEHGSDDQDMTLIDWDYLVNEFEEKRDSDFSDNDVWYGIIDDFFASIT